MSLIVEDGTGRADAESYAAAADVDVYQAALGNTLWAGLSEAEKEQALRRATKFMRMAYRASWAGRRVTQAQALDWPRYGVVVDEFSVLSTTVPPDVKEACCELALRAAAGDLLPDLDLGSNQIKREKIGPLDTEYFQANVDARERFPAVDALLAPYFSSAGGANSIKVVRG